jgi:hypothetical protein
VHFLSDTIRKEIANSITGGLLGASRSLAIQDFPIFYETRKVSYLLVILILCHLKLVRTPSYLKYILIVSVHVWRKLEVESGSTRSHFLENSLWETLWTCRQTNCGMMTLMITHLDLLRPFFPSGFSARTLCVFLFSPTLTTCPPYVTTLDFIALMTYSKERKS